MSQSSHLICKQFVHVELHGSEADGLALQRGMSAYCREIMLAEIERVLEKVGAGEKKLLIDKLELDLRTLQIERLELELAELVAASLEKALQPMIQAAVLLRPGRYSNVQSLSGAESLEEALLFFLNYGYLPWNHPISGFVAFETLLLRAWQQQGETTRLQRLADELREALRVSYVRKRLFLQFSNEFLSALLFSLSPSLQKPVLNILETANLSLWPNTVARAFQQAVWNRALIYCSQASHIIPAPNTILKETFGDLAGSLSLPEQKFLAGILQSNWPGAKDPQLNEPGIQSLHDSAPGNSSHDLTAPDSATQLTEGIYIRNAGLVLLHPFLPQLFSTLGYLKDDRIVEPGKCLTLLHYLVTGHKIAPEYELVLPKLICNLPFQNPVDLDIQLTTAETNEAERMLEAVIGHWSVLGETSPDGLRGTYLVRNGKISMREDGDWLLQVERNSFDILLDQLPWGISMIKLPWMMRMLWVEWI